MDFMAAKSVFFLPFFTCLIVVVVRVCGEESTNATISNSSCDFAEFLQTGCSTSSNICEWTFGRRISLPLEELSSPPSRFRAVTGTTEWTWRILNSTIVVSFMLKSQPRSKTVKREYHCLEKYGKNNNTYIISKKDLQSTNDKNINNFNCIRFLPRSRTVVHYKLGPWVQSVNDVSCSDNTMVLQEYPMIADRYLGVLDCPEDLKGAFDILSVYDSPRQRQCHYTSGKYGILESDCLIKDGLIIDFGSSHNCTNPSLGSGYPQDLRLRCHSRPWTERNITFVVTSRRARWAYEYKKTTFQCLMYNTNQSHGEFDIYLINGPRCGRFIDDGKAVLFNKSDALVLRVRRKTAGDQRLSLLLTTNRCIFPAEVQGLWLEDADHEFKTLQIIQGNITLPSGDYFQCNERFTFKYKHSGCGSSRREDHWPLSGRIGFNYNDYTLITHFKNGCRPRITRLGLSGTVDNHVLVYRLSQSEPVVDDGRSAQEYYDQEILKRLCTMTYLYKQDPYPYWGRNIEKIIHRQRLLPQPIHKCSLGFNNRYNLMSTVAVTQSSQCQGAETKISFGCQEASGAPRVIKISYSKLCSLKDVQFQCVGRAWKYGHFILLLDIATQRLNCVWFDKANNAILRLHSPQCSNVDLSQLSGHTDSFVDRYRIKYLERCPSVPDPTVVAKVAVSSSNKRPSIHNSVWLYTIFVLRSIFVTN